MTHRAFISLTILLTLVPSLAYGYGEGADIPEGSRIIHLLTNEARTNTKDALASCGKACSEGTDCHSEVLPPLYWDDGLYRAAQFHSNMLNDTPDTPKAPCIQHYSPCTLNSDVTNKFPQECNGSPSCACTAHQAKCDEDGTAPQARVMMFADSFSAENLASALSNPYDTFMLWLYEDGNGSGCKQDSNNGHRFNILSAATRMGVGYALPQQGKYYGVATQDFSKTKPTETPALTAGAAYSDNSALWFKTHYYAKTAASKVTVTLDGEQTELTKTRGTETNGVYGTKTITTPANCAKYYFEATDASGTTTRFPTTGFLLYHCESAWLPEEITPDAPDCKDENCQDIPDSQDEPDCKDGNCQDIPDSQDAPDCKDGNCQDIPASPDAPDCKDGNCQGKPVPDAPTPPECAGTDCGINGSVNLINHDNACAAVPNKRNPPTIPAIFSALAALCVFLTRRNHA